MESALSSTAWRKNRARRIQKICEAAPLWCPKCHGAMRIIAFIEEQPVIKKTLSHLGLWQTRPVVRSATREDSNHDPPQARAAPIPVFESGFTIDTLPPTDGWDQ